ncbi:putative TATA box binding protein associated factor (TAF) [Plasmopara halstedii]
MDDHAEVKILDTISEIIHLTPSTLSATVSPMDYDAFSADCIEDTYEDDDRISSTESVTSSARSISGLSSTNTTRSLSSFGNSPRNLASCSLSSDLELINIACAALRQIPSKIQALSLSTKLGIYRRPLKSLKALSELVNLTQLDLSGNAVERLEGIQLLTQMQILTMPRNNIKTLSASLFTLNRLINLDLSGNVIVHLPRAFSGLTVLKELNISGNNLSDLREVDVLAPLGNLLSCNLAANPFCRQPTYKDYIIFKIRFLERLDEAEVSQAARDRAAKRFRNATYSRNPSLREAEQHYENEHTCLLETQSVLEAENLRLKGELQVKSKLLQNKSRAWSSATEQLLQLQQEVAMLNLDRNQNALPYQDEMCDPEQLTMAISSTHTKSFSNQQRPRSALRFPSSKQRAKKRRDSLTENDLNFFRHNDDEGKKHHVMFTGAREMTKRSHAKTFADASCSPVRTIPPVLITKLSNELNEVNLFDEKRDLSEHKDKKLLQLVKLEHEEMTFFKAFDDISQEHCKRADTINIIDKNAQKIDSNVDSEDIVPVDFVLKKEESFSIHDVSFSRIASQFTFEDDLVCPACEDTYLPALNPRSLSASTLSSKSEDAPVVYASDSHLLSPSRTKISFKTRKCYRKQEESCFSTLPPSPTLAKKGARPRKMEVFSLAISADNEALVRRIQALQSCKELLLAEIRNKEHLLHVLNQKSAHYADQINCLNVNIQACIDNVPSYIRFSLSPPGSPRRRSRNLCEQEIVRARLEILQQEYKLIEDDLEEIRLLNESSALSPLFQLERATSLNFFQTTRSRDERCNLESDLDIANASYLLRMKARGGVKELLRFPSTEDEIASPSNHFSERKVSLLSSRSNISQNEMLVEVKADSIDDLTQGPVSGSALESCKTCTESHQMIVTEPKSPLQTSDIFILEHPNDKNFALTLDATLVDKEGCNTFLGYAPAKISYVRKYFLAEDRVTSFFQSIKNDEDKLVIPTHRTSARRILDAAQRLAFFEANSKIDVDSKIELDNQGNSRGSLKVLLHAARDLPTVHLRTKTLDPYVCLEIVYPPHVVSADVSAMTDRGFRSRTKKTSIFPVWDEGFVFAPILSLDGYLYVRVLNNRRLNHEQLVGEVRIPLHTLLHQKRIVEWYSLSLNTPLASVLPAKASPKLCGGSIKLQLQLYFSSVERYKHIVDALVVQYVQEFNRLPAFIDAKECEKEVEKAIVEKPENEETESTSIENAGRQRLRMEFISQCLAENVATSAPWHKSLSTQIAVCTSFSTRRDFAEDVNIALEEPIELVNQPALPDHDYLVTNDIQKSSCRFFKTVLERRMQPFASRVKMPVGTCHNHSPTAHSASFIDTATQQHHTLSRRRIFEEPECFDEYSLYHPASKNMSYEKYSSKRGVMQTSRIIAQKPKETRNTNLSIFKSPNLTRRSPSSCLPERYIGLDNQACERLKRMFDRMDREFGSKHVKSGEQVMSLLRPETVQIVAQSLGLDNIGDDSIRELLPEVELRVREVVQDALKFQRHSRRPQLDSVHINQALQARNLESLYGFSAPGNVKYKPCDENETLYFAEEEELELSELLNAPLGQLPLHHVLNVHWLAVDGVQPLIPENESAEDDSTCHTSIKDEAFVYNVDRKPRVKHALTEEMQLYYTKVTEAVKSDDFELQRAALTSLAQDPGIHQLLPYFSRFIYEEVKHSNHDLSLLFSLMRACRCLLVNQSLHVELYLHQLIPAILTCVLGTQLCENPADDHWALRIYAAKLVAQICECYGEKYANIQSRVSKTYHKAITNPICPFSTQYGALNGMLFLGPLAMESLLFPNLERYYRRLEPALLSSNPNLVERLEAQNCLGILVHASGTYFSKSAGHSASQSLPPYAIVDRTSLLFDAFGESLLPYLRPQQPSMLDMSI